MKPKGELNGACNLSACTSGLLATYYNHGSYAHYCEHCAKRLNSDPYNKDWALKNLGHDLCTLVEPKVIVIGSGASPHTRFPEQLSSVDALLSMKHKETTNHLPFLSEPTKPKHDIELWKKCDYCQGKGVRKIGTSFPIVTISCTKCNNRKFKK